MNQQLSPQFVSFEGLDFFSSLFRDYCYGFDRVASFYHFDYRSRDARVRAAEEAAAHPRDRAGLVEVLREQNSRWGDEQEVNENIEALLDPGSVAVVTGQQVGLFTGPAYTVYKTLTVLQLARQLSEESGRKVVPVFWLEGDDHDLAEVASVAILAQNELKRLSYTGHSVPENGNLGPVGRIQLGDQINEVVDELDRLLPPTDFKPALMDAVRSSYRAGNSILDAFATLMRHLFRGSGLVFISPDDPRLKRLAAPLFEREIRETQAIAGDLEQVSKRLTSGYHAQVAVRPSNLFVVDERGRHPLDVENGMFKLRGNGEARTTEDLLATLQKEPESFSANVVLRPLVQDSLIPTAIYVAGPSEIAYFAQFKPVYERVGIPMPAIYPRASVTIVEGKVRKVLDEYGLDISDMDEDLESLFQQVLRENLGSDTDSRFGEASKHLHIAINELKPLLKEVDPTLLKSAEATRAALLKEFDRFRQRVLKAEKRSHEQVRSKLDKAQINLFPGGKPQERAISILYFVNKYGPDLVGRLQDVLSLDTTSHQVLDV